jgi:hypothetical protein
MVTPFQGGDTSDTSFVRSQQVSNQCHDTSDTGSNKSGNGENQVEKKNEQASDIIAREEATLAVVKETKNGD